MGKKYLRIAAQNHNYLTDMLKDKTPGQVWHRATHNLYTTFQHRCIARGAPEETNLAAYWHKHDVTGAEFIRTFRSVDFPGSLFIKKYEDEASQCHTHKRQKIIPATGSSQPKFLKSMDDLYGYRGRGGNDIVFFLNPWEFMMYWECCPLPETWK